MTLTIAWVRKVGEVEEMVFCSDSRLRFGCSWDSCQKVFPLPRGDCAIAFAGDTNFAYPFINAAINAINFHRGSKRRQVDIFVAKSVLLTAINGMLDELGDFRDSQERFDEPDLRIILGGYSWQKKRFAIWKYQFDHTKYQFVVTEPRGWRNFQKKGALVILGEPNSSPSANKRAHRNKDTPTPREHDVEAIAKEKLIELVSKDKSNTSTWDMEPFEVLRDILLGNLSPHVGGPPQLVKVYQHLNCQPFGVRWPSLRGRVSLLGRMLPKGEIAHVPIINSVTLETETR